mgnify:CR=1 FL=1
MQEKHCGGPSAAFGCSLGSRQIGGAEVRRNYSLCVAPDEGVTLVVKSINAHHAKPASAATITTMPISHLI